MGLTADDVADMTGLGEAEVLLLEAGRLPCMPPDRWGALVACLRLQESRPLSTLLPPLATSRGAKGLRIAPQREGLILEERPRLDGAAPMPSGALWWQRLRLQRRRLGLGVRELAVWSATSDHTIANLEAGCYPATEAGRDALARVAAALCVEAPLPPLPALDLPRWVGWTVAGRGVSVAQARAARVAQSLPPDSPGGQLLTARLRNGWSRLRVAGALGGERRREAVALDVERAEAALAWSPSPSPLVGALCRLWRVRPPVTYASGISTTALRRTRATIAERLTEQAEAGGWTRADICDVADLTPLTLDDALAGRADRGNRYWSTVEKLTAAGWRLVDGLTLPRRLLVGGELEGEDEKG